MKYSEPSHYLIALITLCLPCIVMAGDHIQRSVNADGVVEFSNVKTDVRKPRVARQKTVIYKSLSGEGVVFSDEKPQYGDYEVLHYDCYACNPDSQINWHTIALNTASYKNIVNHAAKRYGVDAALIRAVIHAESSFNPRAVSRHGAEGLMQLMPTTAKELGVKNAFDVTQNINAGAKYLAELLDEFNGDVKLATAAYNAGPNAVKAFRGIPPYSETQVYVERVGILHQRYQHAS